MSHLVWHSVYSFCSCVTLMLMLTFRVVKVYNMYSRIFNELILPQNRGNYRRYEDKNQNYSWDLNLENNPPNVS